MRALTPEQIAAAAAEGAAAPVAKEGAARRVYKVRNIKDGSVRLVNATSIAQASRHVAKDNLDVTIPTTVEALTDAKNHNIEVEEA
jgi:hypothetical protein